MKLSIVVICWNDLKVIKECLESIYTETKGIPFEVIVSDNGSTDGSTELIETQFPQVRIVRNGANLGFARGNNAGIKVAQGEYVLILNPDTIIHDQALTKLITFADQHPEAGAFGCAVMNRDGSDQRPSRPLPSPRSVLLSALGLHWLGRFSKRLLANRYPDWTGTEVREIGRQSGCCILARRELLNRLGGFDEQFFYHFEEVDLCCRIWKSGSKILYTPAAKITHLGGQSVGRFPIRFALETHRSQYRYFYKHFGLKGARQVRKINLLNLALRRIGYSVVAYVKPSEAIKNRLEMYRVITQWNKRLDPVRFLESGEEPNLGYAPLAPASRLAVANN